MPDHDDNTGLLNLALEQYGMRRRLALALAASVILNAVLIGVAWSVWLARP